ncbi:hypothetical protein WMY93_000246 [Mugilogobius chulae]|uniref:C2H2-type domain-containing protein n=1 Tax=Mugilogobius chulae TaxID=88201 RepID=A0AAW0Q0B9_9GOBI
MRLFVWPVASESAHKKIVRKTKNDAYGKTVFTRAWIVVICRVQTGRKYEEERCPDPNRFDPGQRRTRGAENPTTGENSGSPLLRVKVKREESDDEEEDSSVKERENSSESESEQHFCTDTDDSDDWTPQTPQKQPREQLQEPAHTTNNGTETENPAKPHKCSECGKAFDTRTKVRVHEKNHRTERPFSCPFCERAFKKNGALITHLRIHTGEKPFRCLVCAKDFQYGITLKAHMRAHTGEKPFSCSVCATDFTSEYLLRVHGRTHSSGETFKCSICDKDFITENRLKRHMTIHTKDRPFGCSVCGERFNTSSRLKTHARIHTGERLFTCAVCDKDFTRKSFLKKHTRSHTGERPFSCSVCDKSFAHKFNLQRHKCFRHTQELLWLTDTEHRQKRRNMAQVNLGDDPGLWEPNEEKNTEILELKQETTDDTGVQSCDDESFFLHIKTESDDEEMCEVFPVIVPVQSENQEQEFTQAAVDQHSTSQSNDFSDKWTSTKAHNIEKPHSCTICSKGFSLKVNLKKHLTTHSSDRPFGCYICAKRFWQKITMQRHIATHSTRFKCWICPEIFLEKKQLEQHMKYHTENGPHKCSICVKICGSELQLRSAGSRGSPGLQLYPSRRNSGGAFRVRAQLLCALCRWPLAKRRNMAQVNLEDDPGLWEPNEEKNTEILELKQETTDDTGVQSCDDESLFLHIKTESDDEEMCEVFPVIVPVQSENQEQEFTQAAVDQRSTSQSNDFSEPDDSDEWTSRHRSIKAHNIEKPHSCTICYKRFSHKDILRKHMTTHSSDRPFGCYICAKRFWRKITMQRHIATHSTRFECWICPEIFLEKQQLEQHMKYHTENGPHKCSICDKVFEDVEVYKEHLKWHKQLQNKFKCSNCNEFFTTTESLRKHGEIYRDEERLVCLLCPTTFTTITDLRQHTEGHMVRPYSCSVCGELFHTHALRKEHAKIHKKRYDCSKCDMFFKTMLSLQKHETDIHKNEKPLACSLCSMIFHTKDELTKHLCEKEGLEEHLEAQELSLSFEKAEENEKQTPKMVKMFGCSYCKDVFLSKSGVIIHEKIHQVEKQTIAQKQLAQTQQKVEILYSCSVCAKSFIDRAELQKHRETHETNNSISEELEEVLEHRNEIQEDIKNYRCPLCSKDFLTAMLLKQHLERHDQGKLHKCPHCEESFDKIQSWSAHVKTHTNQEIVEVFLQSSCSVCKKTFSSQCDLDKHILSHLAEKPYSCSVCAEAFAKPKHLQRHVRTAHSQHVKVHNKMKTFSASVCGEASSESEQTQQHVKNVQAQSYSCSVCAEAFAESKQLQQHMKTAHTKSYRCSLCEMTFSRPAYLNLHAEYHARIKTFSPSVCEEAFAESEQSQQHMKTANAKSYKCSLCEMTFSRQEYLDEHAEYHAKYNTKPKNSAVLFAEKLLQNRNNCYNT